MLHSIFNVPPSLVDFVSQKLVALLGFLAAVGVLSMAIVQVLKDLGPIRQWFNRNFLWSWFLERLRTKESVRQTLRRQRIWGWGRSPAGDHQVKEAIHEAVVLATGGYELALLDLGVEQLCGQLTSASQVALEYPGRYRHFYDVLTAGAESEDVKTVLAGNPASVEFRSDSSASKAEPDLAKQRYTEARARLGQYVQRSIDALHIRLGARWKWWMQFSAFIVSAIVTYAALILHRHGAAISFADAVRIVGASFVAGFLAPIARDLVAALPTRK